jgi:hypothetical protein
MGRNDIIYIEWLDQHTLKRSGAKVLIWRVKERNNDNTWYIYAHNVHHDAEANYYAYRSDLKRSIS